MKTLCMDKGKCDKVGLMLQWMFLGDVYCLSLHNCDVLVIFIPLILNTRIMPSEIIFDSIIQLV